MAILISPSGQKEEICYYDIEQRFIDIVQNLDNDKKEQFEEFKKDYHYFTPYFDFVIMELGYMIENPMGYTHALLLYRDHKIMIIDDMDYEKYQKEGVFHPIYDYFVKCDDVTLNIHQLVDELDHYPNDINQLENSIIDRNNMVLSIEHLRFHQNLAFLIVNQLIIKDKKIYDLYISYDEIVTKEINFLEDKLGYIRLGMLENTLIPCYRRSLLSDKQLQFILELEHKKYVQPFLGDKDTAERIEYDSFHPKKS